MATYGEVKTQFSDVLNRRDCTTSQKTTFFQQGFERIQRELRIPAMQKAVSIEVDETNYVTGLTIPSDLIELDTITIDTDYDSWPLSRKALSEVLTASKVLDLPRIFARRGGEWILGPFPLEGTAIRIDYFGEYPGVEADEDENIITIICPSLIVYAALSLAGDQFKDKRRDDWEKRYQQIRDELHGQADEDELSGGSAVSQVYSWPADDC
jgi:hypothetical protein